jgi:hypothetical protein
MRCLTVLVPLCMLGVVGCHNPCATAPDPPSPSFSGVVEPGADVIHEHNIPELLNGGARLT